MMMRTTRFALVGLLGILGGCATVRATKSPGVSEAQLTQYRTFSWYQPAQPTAGHQSFMRSPAGQTVQNALAQNLAQKGMTETSTNPDVLVSYHVKLQREWNVTDWGYAPGWWGYYGPGGVTVNQYTEGTIFVDFIDPHTNQVVWRGTVQSVVNHPENPNPTKIAKAVDKLMKKFPTQVAGAGAPPRM